MKTINLKITAASPNSGPFNIKDDRGNVLANDVSLSSLISGVVYEVDDAVSVVTLISTGDCEWSKNFSVTEGMTAYEYQNHL